jgi:hypothetical protein
MYNKIIYHTDDVSRRVYRRLAQIPAEWFFRNKFLRAFQTAHKAFWVVDIDNTIAATAEKLTPQYRLEHPYHTQYQRLMAIEPLEGMRHLLATKPAHTRLIFFSARSYDVYWTTQKWLKQHGFWQPDATLILVHRMLMKPQYFEKLLFPNSQPDTHNPQLITHNSKNTPPQYDITFFDDLSYNKERGELKFFDEAIAATQKLPIQYIGYDELLKINEIN